MLLRLEKGIRRCKCIKNCDKNKKSPYFKLWDVNHLYGWSISQKLPVNDLNGLKMFLNLMKSPS